MRIGFETGLNYPYLAEFQYETHVGGISAYKKVVIGICVGIIFDRRLVHGIGLPERIPLLTLRSGDDTKVGWYSILKLYKESM